MTPLRFDTTALQDPVDPDEARAAGRRRMDEVLGGDGNGVMLRRILFHDGVLVIGFGILAALAVMLVQSMFGMSGANASTWIIAALMVAPLAVTRIMGHVRERREQYADWQRLTRFAEANGLDYELLGPPPQDAASLFARGSQRTVRDRFFVPSRGVEIANYDYERMVARTRMQHSASYIAFAAPARTPAMTLVSRANDVWSQPPAPPAGHREIAVDEGFDAKFRVFCAPADDDAVRRTLSADLRDGIVALASRCDVEITGGRVYVVARRALSMTRHAFWRWVADVMDLMDHALVPPQTPVSAELESAWASRRPEREALFAPQSNRSVGLGCLVVVLGLVAAALVANFG